MISLLAYKFSVDVIDLILQQSFQRNGYLCVYYFVNLRGWVCLFLTGFSATQCVNELFRYSVSSNRGGRVIMVEELERFKMNLIKG